MIGVDVSGRTAQEMSDPGQGGNTGRLTSWLAGCRMQDAGRRVMYDSAG